MEEPASDCHFACLLLKAKILCLLKINFLFNVLFLKNAFRLRWFLYRFELHRSYTLSQILTHFLKIKNLYKLKQQDSEPMSVLKTSVLARAPWVRIPPSPPLLEQSSYCIYDIKIKGHSIRKWKVLSGWLPRRSICAWTEHT